jgi:hypothetical protein
LSKETRACDDATSDTGFPHFVKLHRWHCRSEDPVKSPGYNRIRGTKPGVAYLLVGSALYLVGTVLVASAFNVPRNEALAVDPVSTDATNLWAGYVTNWTIWNHMRTAAALAAPASLTVALSLSPARPAA